MCFVSVGPQIDSSSQVQLLFIQVQIVVCDMSWAQNLVRAMKADRSRWRAECLFVKENLRSQTNIRGRLAISNTQRLSNSMGMAAYLTTDSSHTKIYLVSVRCCTLAPCRKCVEYHATISSRRGRLTHETFVASVGMADPKPMC